MIDTTREQKNLLISVLNWNGLTDTLAYIANIAPTEGVDWDILVIDNGSSEDPC